MKDLVLLGLLYCGAALVGEGTGIVWQTWLGCAMLLHVVLAARRR